MSTRWLAAWLAACGAGAVACSSGTTATEPRYSVTGRVWKDLNENGAFDAGDKGISGVTLAISGASGAGATAVTGSDGTYSFSDVVAGKHTICISSGVRAGDLPTYDADGIGSPGCATIDAGSATPAVDFGFKPIPRLMLESPVRGQTISDTLMVVKGVAEAPGGVGGVIVKYRTPLPDGSLGPEQSILLYQVQYVSGKFDWRDSVPFSTQIRLAPGALLLQVEMDYRLRDSQLQPRFLTDTLPIRVYRKPTLTIDAGVADTLYQRGLTLRATAHGIEQAPRIEVVVDAGTASARRISNFDTLTKTIEFDQRFDSTSWRIDFPDTLSNGRHTLRVRLRDELGLVDSVSRSFVTYVADAPYALLALPGLSGSDADALGVNASGDVAGWARDATGFDHALLWRAGAATALPVSPTARTSRARSVNDAGDVVGVTNDTTSTGYCDRGVLWRGATWTYVGVGTNYCGQSAKVINAGGDLLILKPLSRDTTGWIVRARGATTPLIGAYPDEMNAQGIVVGTQDRAGGISDLGPAVKYPTFRPLTSGGRLTFGEKYSINATGQIVGAYNTTLYFSATPDVEALDLNPYLGPARYMSVAIPVHITDNGTILAFHEEIKTAFLWRNGKTSRVKLSTPGFTLDRVASMNDRGQIIGHAIETSTGLGRAVLLNPAP